MHLNEVLKSGRLLEPLTDDQTADLARPYSMHELLDFYAEAERNRENEVAVKLRWLIDGRLARVDAWSMGSSIVREAINGLEAK